MEGPQTAGPLPHRERPSIGALVFLVVSLAVTFLVTIFVARGIQERYLPPGIAAVATLLSFAGFIIARNADVARQKNKSLTEQMAVDLEEKTRALANKNVELEAQVAARTAALAKKVQESEEAKTAILNVLDDLTVAKEDLEGARAYDEALVASIADGVMAVDTQGRITAVNEAAVKLLGRASRDLLGKSAIQVISMVNEAGVQVPRDERPLFKAIHASAGQVFRDSAHFYERADGTRFPVAIDTAPIVLGGRLAGAIEVLRDFTREREVDRAKSEFVSLASHQLRTPLTAIGWYTELLLSDEAGPLTEEQRDYLTEVHESNRRMVSLVDALLNVSRIEMGTLTVQGEATPLVPLIRRVLAQFSIQIKERALDITEHYEDELASVLADAHLLEVVVENLLSNAVKYTPKGGTISVALSGAGDQLVLTVADSGIGIPAAQQGKVFDKLFRADNARLSDTDGSGLGLYLVKSIVERLDGSIDFESAEGKGSTFRVRLPPAKPGKGV